MWAIAALLTGFAGAVYYLNSSRCTTGRLQRAPWTAPIIVIVVIGGLGTIEGPIIGVVYYCCITERFADSDTWRFLVLGTVAVVMAAVAP